MWSALVFSVLEVPCSLGRIGLEVVSTTERLISSVVAFLIRRDSVHQFLTQPPLTIEACLVLESCDRDSFGAAGGSP